MMVKSLLAQKKRMIPNKELMVSVTKDSEITNLLINQAPPPTPHILKATAKKGLFFSWIFKGQGWWAKQETDRRVRGCIVGVRSRGWDSYKVFPISVNYSQILLRFFLHKIKRIQMKTNGALSVHKWTLQLEKLWCKNMTLSWLPFKTCLWYKVISVALIHSFMPLSCLLTSPSHETEECGVGEGEREQQSGLASLIRPHLFWNVVWCLKREQGALSGRKCTSGHASSNWSNCWHGIALPPDPSFLQ